MDTPPDARDPLTAPTPVARLVAPQPGAVVSRTLVSKRGGTVTAFAFDEGEGLSEHRTPFDALVIGVDGDARITVGGADHRLGAGEALLLPADVPHAVHALTPFRMLLVMVRETPS